MKKRATILRARTRLRNLRAAVCVFVLLLSVTPPAKAEPAAPEMPAARLEQMFHEAGRAYDQGRFEEAISLYEQLLSSGHVSKEALFNLGNAAFRSGRIGKAVLYYRRASFFAPRDPDIMANLKFALQTGGAAPPHYNAPMRSLLRFSEAEWVLFTTAAYWIAALCAAWLLIPSARFKPVFLRMLAISGLLLLVGILGIGSWARMRRHPEVVVMKPQQQALFAPLEQNATPHFALAEGSIVRAVEFSGSWVRIASGNREGWIRREVCEPVRMTGGP